MLSPQITQSNLFILGDRKSSKNSFLNFLRLIFESFMHVIKFEKHLVLFLFQKSRISGFGGLGGHFNYSLATESLAFGGLNVKFRASLATESAGFSNDKLPWENSIFSAVERSFHTLK
jgi:hypothetical protein